MTHAKFQSGEGTVDSPYIICDSFQLKSLAGSSNFWANHFRLGANIDMDGVSFDGIGIYDFDSESGQAFTGSFDGRSYKIQNLLVNHSSTDFSTGLFNYTNSATIKNLTLENVRIYSDKYAGALIGKAENSEIQNISVTGIVNANTTASNFIGGLIGHLTNDSGSKSVSNVSLDMEIVGYDAVGGLAGWIEVKDSSSLVVNNISSKGKVDSIPIGGGNTFGGILGILRSVSGASVSVTNVSAEVNLVLGPDGSRGSFSAVGFGTAVCDNSSLSIKNVKAMGDITTPAAFNTGFIGGLAGTLGDTTCISAVVENVGYEGTIKVTSANRSRIGGLFGSMGNYSLKNSYANANIIVTQDGLASAGGLIGSSGNGIVQVQNCHSNSTISASNLGSNIGGLIGYVGATGALDLTDNFYNSDRYTLNSDALGNDTNSGVSNLTNSEMSDSGNFSNWDFSNVWKITSGYPKLR